MPLALNLIALAALAALAVCVSARVMKVGTGFSFQTLEKDDAGDYLDVPRGIMTGTLWATVIWAALLALLVAGS